MPQPKYIRLSLSNYHEGSGLALDDVIRNSFFIFAIKAVEEKELLQIKRLVINYRPEKSYFIDLCYSSESPVDLQPNPVYNDIFNMVVKKLNIKTEFKPRVVVSDIRKEHFDSLNSYEVYRSIECAENIAQLFRAAVVKTGFIF